MSPSRRLKVAHAYQESGIRFSQSNAAQLHIFHTMRGLQRAGHEVALLALQVRQVLFTQDLGVFGPTKLTASHFAQLGCSGSTKFKWFESGARRLQSLLRLPYFALFDSYRLAEAGRLNLKGYDLIHERFNLLALGGVWASRSLGIPLVLEVNADLLAQRKFKGVPERGLRRLVAVWATRNTFGAAAKIICISGDLKKHIISQWNVPESKVAVLPCAADLEAFGRDYDPKPIRHGLGLTNEPVIVWVGGFYPWHDIELLLRSFAQVVSAKPDARLVLVGDGPTRPAVARQIQNAGLQEAVILTGAVAHARVPELVSIGDVAVVPAAPVSAGAGGTGTPLKLFEYMAAGKAIVATASSQAAEVISDEENGILVKAGDVNGFAGAILALLENGVERCRLGQNARKRAVEQHSWDLYTRHLEEIYWNVLDVAQTHSSPA